MKSKKNKELKPKGVLKRCISEMTGLMSIIEIHSDFDVTISGCKGIIDYDCSHIIADTISGVVKVEGNSLTLNVFHGDVINISGKIISVWLE